MRRISRRLGTALSGAPWGTSRDPKPAIDLPKVISSCELSWPAPGQLRMRRIISRSRAIATGKYPSVKIKRWVHWESKVERDGQRLVDVAPNVSSFCEQPVAIEFGDEDRIHRHIPDLLVRFLAGKAWLVEFKDDRDPELEVAQLRASLLRAPLAVAGFSYLLVLGSVLRRKSYLANALWLRRHGRLSLDIVTWERARRTFCRVGSMTLREFCKAIGNEQTGLRAAAALTLVGDIQFDMAEPIGSETVMNWRVDGNGGGEWLSALFSGTK